MSSSLPTPRPVTIQAISVRELADRLASDPDSVQLVDVREPQELAIVQLPGFINLPLSEANQWSDRIHTLLSADRETWVLCHHGMRSAQMCQWLATQGFSQLGNITGGIDAYAIEVDRSIGQY